jgi:hypothetical protein
MALIEVGDLGVPINTLVEKISNAIGHIAEPHLIRRRAAAEAAALITSTKAKNIAATLEARTAARIEHQQIKRQINIESVAAIAFDNLSPQATPEKIDDDWLSLFFRHCELVSDEQMQTLWGRILATEAERSGAFSKRTLAIVATLSKLDAEDITTLGQFCVKIESEQHCLVTDHNHPLYIKAGLKWSKFKHLATAGIIVFDDGGGLLRSSGYGIQLTNQSDPKLFNFSYFDREYQLELTQPHAHIHMGSVMLTDSGKELIEICGATANHEFMPEAFRYWRNREVIVPISVP